MQLQYDKKNTDKKISQEDNKVSIEEVEIQQIARTTHNANRAEKQTQKR